MSSQNSMGDKFSFPVMIQSSDHFEFGSITSSPSSPADHLFSNGKLLPHTYPTTLQFQTSNNNFSYSYSYSRSTSRTSSSKDSLSLMSSRSNSTNSRSSTSCSSARTSISEASSSEAARRKDKIVRPVMTSCQYQYGSSRRWQLIAAAPVLKRQASSSRSSKKIDRKVSKTSDEGSKGSKSWSFFKSFISACQECHAIKT